MAASVSFSSRLWLAFACLFRVLTDGRFAARVVDLDTEPRHPPRALPAHDGRDAVESDEEERGDDGDDGDQEALETAVEQAVAKALEEQAATRADVLRGAAEEARREGALQLLTLLQREGRLVDFLKQDISGFDDDDIGAAARVVHEGCGRVLARVADIAAVRQEDEESQVVVDEGYDADAIKLSGDVKGTPPHRGTLRHGGWRARRFDLPTKLAGYDATVIQPAEVEL